jgi:hypothetical protein
MIPRSRAFKQSVQSPYQAGYKYSQKDTQVGFEVGKGEIMRAIFRNASINRYAFDVELFTIASLFCI